jgi:hypothetical protein
MIIPKMYRCMLVSCLLVTMYDVQGLVAFDQRALASIDQKKVDEYQRKVVEEFKHNTQIRFAVAAIGAVSISLGVYAMFFKSTNPGDLSQNIHSKPEAVAADIVLSHVELKDVLDKIVRGMAKEGYDVGQELNWSAWFKSWGRFLGKQSVSLVLGSVLSNMLNPFTKYFSVLDKAVDKLINRIFHEGDINWFLSVHTNFYSLLDQLEHQASAFCGSTNVENHNNVQDKDYHCTVFINTWNLYINQLASMLGFMKYKANLLGKTSEFNAQRIFAIIDEIILLTNDTAKSINVGLFPDGTKHELSHVNEQVRTMRRRIGVPIEAFINAESLVSY